MGRGNEFSAIADPGKFNALADSVRPSKTVRMVKRPDPGAAIPSVHRYMYLQRDQALRMHSPKLTAATNAPPAAGTHSAPAILSVDGDKA